MPHGIVPVGSDREIKSALTPLPLHHHRNRMLRIDSRASSHYERWLPLGISSPSRELSPLSLSQFRGALHDNRSQENRYIAAHLNAPSADMPIGFAAVTKARLAVIATNATLRNAAVALSSPHIGLVIIREENGTVAGVVSKFDLVQLLMLDRPEDELSVSMKPMKREQPVRMGCGACLRQRAGKPISKCRSICFLG